MDKNTQIAAVQMAAVAIIRKILTARIQPEISTTLNGNLQPAFAPAANVPNNLVTVLCNLGWAAAPKWALASASNRNRIVINDT
jgi:hypothetical protein